MFVIMEGVLRQNEYVSRCLLCYGVTAVGNQPSVILLEVLSDGCYVRNFVVYKTLNIT